MAKSKKTVFSWIVLAVYVIFLTWVIVFKFGYASLSFTGYRLPINWIPFGGSAMIGDRIDYSEIVSNVLVFIPLGLCLSMLGRPKSALLRVAVGLALSVAFEAVQYLFHAGSADITDVIMNTFGTALGVLAFIPIKKLLKERAETVTGITILVLTALFVAAFIFVLG